MKPRFRSVPCRFCGRPVVSAVRRGRAPSDCGRHPRSQTREQYASRVARNPEHDAAIVAAWQAGASGVEVGQAFGVSHERVRQILLRNGVGSMLHRKTHEWTCDICGATCTGTRRAHTRAALHAFRVIKREPSKKTLAMAEEYRAGVDVREIMSRHGVSRSAAYRAGHMTFGPLRRSAYQHKGPRTTARQSALVMLRNGDPDWLVAEATDLRRSDVYYLRRRYLP